MAIILASLAPVFIILFYIYFRDKYDREPVRLLAMAVLLGVVTVLPVLLVEKLLVLVMPEMSRIPSAAYNAFVVAGFTEEIFKYLALYLLIWRSPSFNEKFDGIVYAVFVSLGFAAVENVMYVLEGGYQTALVRAFTAVPAHALFGVTMGYYFGTARMYPELRKSYIRRAILVPMFLHGLYDFILMAGIDWLLILFIGYVLYLYLMGLKKIRVLSDASIYKPVDEPSE